MEITNQAVSNQEVGAGISAKVESFLARKPVILQLLRFGAIGVINTALDFLVLNFVSKTLGITSGLKLGQVNVIGFALAVVQSYYWNRAWTFNFEQTVSLWKNFWRLVFIGILGAAGVLLVLIGSKLSAPASLYLVALILFIVVEVILWEAFGLTKLMGAGQGREQFVLFVTVSIIGLIINSALVALVSQYWPLTSNVDLNKNIAKILATFVSLVWNFMAYKLIVFKR